MVLAENFIDEYICVGQFPLNDKSFKHVATVGCSCQFYNGRRQDKYGRQCRCEHPVIPRVAPKPRRIES